MNVEIRWSEGTKIADKIDNIRKAIAHGKKGLADKVAKAKKNAQKRCKKLTDNKKKKKKNKDAAIDCGTNCGGGKKSPVKIGLQKRYIKNIESITGLKIKQKQREKIKESLRNKEYKKLSKAETAKHRSKFSKSKKDKLIKEWEKETGQKWPEYDEVILDKNGDVYRNKGDKYDAHHVIENNYGGEHEWWNMHPAKSPSEHQGGIHGSGAPAKELFN